MSKFFKTKKKLDAAPPAPQPREMKEIRDEFITLSGNAGQLQYQIYALSKELEQLNQRILNINHEGAARTNLDAAKKDEAKSE